VTTPRRSSRWRFQTHDRVDVRRFSFRGMSDQCPDTLIRRSCSPSREHDHGSVREDKANMPTPPRLRGASVSAMPMSAGFCDLHTLHRIFSRPLSMDVSPDLSQSECCCDLFRCSGLTSAPCSELRFENLYSDGQRDSPLQSYADRITAWELSLYHWTTPALAPVVQSSY
jgi:hypothetical protein